MLVQYLFYLVFRNRSMLLDLQLEKAAEVIPDLISEAIKARIQANYVLFDSWCSSPKVLRSMKELGLDVVAMVKKSSNIHYCFRGRCVPARIFSTAASTDAAAPGIF